MFNNIDLIMKTIGLHIKFLIACILLSSCVTSVTHPDDGIYADPSSNSTTIGNGNGVQQNTNYQNQTPNNNSEIRIGREYLNHPELYNNQSADQQQVNSSNQIPIERPVVINNNYYNYPNNNGWQNDFNNPVNQFNFGWGRNSWVNNFGWNSGWGFNNFGWSNWNGGWGNNWAYNQGFYGNAWGNNFGWGVDPWDPRLNQGWYGNSWGNNYGYPRYRHGIFNPRRNYIISPFYPQHYGNFGQPNYQIVRHGKNPNDRGINNNNSNTRPNNYNNVPVQPNTNGRINTNNSNQNRNYQYEQNRGSINNNVPVQPNVNGRVPAPNNSNQRDGYNKYEQSGGGSNGNYSSSNNRTNDNGFRGRSGGGNINNGSYRGGSGGSGGGVMRSGQRR